MKNIKLLIVCLFFFSVTKLSAQYIPIENPKVEINEKHIIRTGYGLGYLGNSIEVVTFNFELGYQYRWNDFLSASFILNYGISLDEVLEFRALQSHSSIALFFSPSKNNKEYAFRIGGGISTLAAYDFARWNESKSGISNGFCIVMENEIQTKKGKTRFIDLHIGSYKNGSIVSLSFLSGISFSKIKRARQKRKAMLRS